MLKFSRNDSGQVAVIFALAALPLIALTSAALDYSTVTKERNAISNGLDAAVLAAANNNAITDSEKHLYAETHFRANYSGDIDLQLTPTIELDRVKLSAHGVLDLTFGNVIGIDDLIVTEASAATIANENTICLMALNETAPEAILFDGGISYSSPTCAVQANSTHASALTSTSRKPPSGQSFCAVGGATGEFEPYVKGECAAVPDPYANTVLPTIPNECSTPFSDLVVLKETNGRGRGQSEAHRAELQERLSNAIDNNSTTARLNAAVFGFIIEETEMVFDADLGENMEVSLNRTGSDVDIKPGVICGGLTIDGINVDFLPGEYIIKDGPLSFINGAEAVAENVTFILAGKGAVLNVQSQSSLDLKAAKTGPRKGLAVMEAVDSSAPGNRTVEEDSSLIADGGELQVLGTVYLPQQQLRIFGKNTSIRSSAPSTSFVADRLRISGGNGSKMVLGVDHVAAGMPPILPRAEDGARLVE